MKNIFKIPPHVLLPEDKVKYYCLPFPLPNTHTYTHTHTHTHTHIHTDNSVQLTAKKANYCNSSGRIIGRQTQWAHHNPVNYCRNIRECFVYYRYIRASSTLRRMIRKLPQSSRISREKLKRCVEKNCVMHAYYATK